MTTQHDVMRRAAAVWKALTLFYGEKFTTVYGLDPDKIWVSQIAELTDDECRHGVTVLGKKGNRDFPCNLTEFVAACRDGDVSPRVAAPGVPRARPPSTLPPCRPEVRDHYLANIKAKLGMEPRE